MLAQSLCLVAALFAFADEPKSAALIQTLPDDGTWATFNVIIKLNGKEQLPTWSIRSVGQVLHAGKQCRWIEMEQIGDSPEFQNLTWRLLVPNEDFGESKHPLGKPAKVWRKIDKQDPESIDKIEIADILFATLLNGPISNVKTEEAKEKISWQQGDLECTIVAGRSEIEFGTVKIGWDQRVFRHQKIPFGFAGLRAELKINAAGQQQDVSIHMSLRDHGKDAKATLPDLMP